MRIGGGWRSAYLEDAEYVRKLASVLIHRSEENKEMVRRGVTHQQNVVRRVPIVGGHVEGHHLLQELLRGLVVGEEGVL